MCSQCSNQRNLWDVEGISSMRTGTSAVAAVTTTVLHSSPVHHTVRSLPTSDLLQLVALGSRGLVQPLDIVVGEGLHALFQVSGQVF